MSRCYPSEMDIDRPPVNGSGVLKRSSSAPMINDNNSILSATSRTPPPSVRESSLHLFSLSQPRTRRFSASFSPVLGSPSSGGHFRMGRVSQLRQEEQADVCNLRELAHEREVHQSMQISQSWEDLSLMEGSNECWSMSNSSSSSSSPPVTKMLGPLHVSTTTASVSCNNNPSVTPNSNSHNSGQHFSSGTLPSPSGGLLNFQSPTRTTCTRSNIFIRRSASPVLRPSSLTCTPIAAKRKLDDSSNLLFHDMSPVRAKRFLYERPSTSSHTNSGMGLLTAVTGRSVVSSAVNNTSVSQFSGTTTANALTTTSSPSLVHFRPASNGTKKRCTRSNSQTDGDVGCNSSSNNNSETSKGEKVNVILGSNGIHAKDSANHLPFKSDSSIMMMITNNSQEFLKDDEMH